MNLRKEFEKLIEKKKAEISEAQRAIAAAAATAKTRASAFAGGSSVALERHVFVGDVTKVSSTQLTVKTTTGQTQTAKLDDKTVITSAKSAKAPSSPRDINKFRNCSGRKKQEVVNMF